LTLLVATALLLDRSISSNESEQIFFIFGTPDTQDEARFTLISTQTARQQSQHNHI